MKIIRTITIRFEADADAVVHDQRDTERRLFEEQLFQPVKDTVRVFHQSKTLNNVAFRVDVFEGADKPISAVTNDGGETNQ